MSDLEFYGSIVLAGIAFGIALLAVFKLDERLLDRRRARRGGDITPLLVRRPK